MAALPGHLSPLRAQRCLPTFVFPADCRSCSTVLRNSAMLQVRFIECTVHKYCIALVTFCANHPACLLFTLTMITRSQSKLTPPSTPAASSSFSASTSTVPRTTGIYQRFAGRFAVCSLAELYGFKSEGEHEFLLKALTSKSSQLCSKIMSWSDPRLRATSERPGFYRAHRGNASQAREKPCFKYERSPSSRHATLCDVPRRFSDAEFYSDNVRGG